MTEFDLQVDKAIRENDYIIIKNIIDSSKPLILHEMHCRFAVRYERLNILKLFCENNFNWDKWTTTWCGQYGGPVRLEMLKYARDNGCPWDETLIENAICYRNWDILVWAIKKGCPIKNLDIFRKQEFKIINLQLYNNIFNKN